MEKCKFCNTDIKTLYVCDLCLNLIDLINKNSSENNVEIPASWKSIEKALKISRFLYDYKHNIDIDIFEDGNGGVEVYIEYMEVPMVLLIDSEGNSSINSSFQCDYIDLSTKEGCLRLLDLAEEEYLLNEEQP